VDRLSQCSNCTLDSSIIFLLTQRKSERKTFKIVRKMLHSFVDRRCYEALSMCHASQSKKPVAMGDPTHNENNNNDDKMKMSPSKMAHKKSNMDQRNHSKCKGD
ncbi:unnamed protein product, partial [Meganyctiphanes norvegica]